MLKRLRQLSPYPIKVQCVDDDSAGALVWGKHLTRKPYIELGNHLNNVDKIRTLAHELGHAQCYRRQCSCYLLKSYVLKEYHAIKFSLRIMLRYKLLLPLALEMLEIEQIVKDNDFDKREIKARKMVMQDKIWKRCKKEVQK